MKCDGCGSSEATKVVARIGANGQLEESCNICDPSIVLTINVPDVYFDKPYFDSNLGDANKPGCGHGQWVNSKRHKAQILKEQGLRECNDSDKGSKTRLA